MPGSSPLTQEISDSPTDLGLGFEVGVEGDGGGGGDGGRGKFTGLSETAVGGRTCGWS